MLIHSSSLFSRRHPGQVDPGCSPVAAPFNLQHLPIKATVPKLPDRTKQQADGLVTRSALRSIVLVVSYSYSYCNPYSTSNLITPLQYRTIIYHFVLVRR